MQTIEWPFLATEALSTGVLTFRELHGIQHWEDSRQRSWDIERLALLEAAGWIVIRVSAEMLKRPQVIVDRVGRALVSRGCPET
jgi:very-short-patch-repair endonuclease